MLRLILLLAIAGTSTMFGQIQEEYDILTHTAYWKVGEERSYKFTIDEVIVQDGDTVEVQQTTFDANISVDDLDERGYYLEWERSNTVFTPEASYNDALYSFLEDVTVEIETEKSGELKYFTNWEDLRDEAFDVADDVMDEYSGIGEIKWRAESLKRSFFDESAMISRGLEEITTFLKLNSSTFTISEQLDTVYKDSFTYGGRKMDYHIKREVLDYSIEEGYYMLSSYTEPDPAQFLEVIFDIMVEDAEKTGDPVPKRDELPNKLEYFTSTTTTIRTDGWIDNLTEYSVASQVGQVVYRTLRIEAK